MTWLARRRSIRRCVGASLLGALLAGCSPGAPTVDRAARATSARAFLDHYVATIASGDAARVVELFCPDQRFAWYTDGQLSYSAPAEVAAGLARYAGMTFVTEVSDVEVVMVADDVASLRSGFATELTVEGNPVHRYGGAMTLLLERTTDGWHVVLGHTSTPGGPPGNAGEGAERPR